jgi:hypothetical protein
MLISANTVEELNELVNAAIGQGLHLWGSPFVVPLSYHNKERFFQQVSNVDQSSGAVDGKSAYQIWTEQPGNANKSVEEFLESLQGEPGKDGVDGTNGADGKDGTNGVNGKSAYQIWTEQPGNSGKTIEEFLESLIGAPGPAGKDGTNGTNGADGESAYETWLKQPGNAGKTEQEFLDSLKATAASHTRKKTEVVYSNVNVTFPANTNTNLINAVKALTPSAGTLVGSPFFNTSDNLLHSFNQNESMFVKINFIGTFTGGSGVDRSMTLDFVGTNGNKLINNRPDNLPADDMSFNLFISVDKDGNVATNGTAMTINPTGAYIATRILMIAEQYVME